MESNNLTIVIVTLKSEEKIFSCLNTIPRELRVIIVENSSNLDFKKNIENKYTNVRCILTGGNKGYSVANNLGLKQVKSKFALVLNPDAVINQKSLENFFSFSNQNKDFWLLGPGNSKEKNHFESEKSIIEVENLKGYAIFFNMEKFNNNFFDENYFLYFEEIDLCKKVLLQGGKIFLNNKIIIDHEGASSVKSSRSLELEKSRNWHWMWSTFYYHTKHKGFLIAFLIILPKLLSSFVKIIFYQLILNKEKKDIYFCRLSGILNSMMGKKSWYRPSLD